jgi:hypothetical protein
VGGPGKGEKGRVDQPLGACGKLLWKTETEGEGDGDGCAPTIQLFIGFDVIIVLKISSSQVFRILYSAVPNAFRESVNACLPALRALRYAAEKRFLIPPAGLDWANQPTCIVTISFLVNGSSVTRSRIVFVLIAKSWRDAMSYTFPCK